MKKVLAAGGIVIRKNKREIEIAFIKDSYGRWAFPKGHVEKGEGVKAAALREVKEEIGCGEVKIKKYLGQMKYQFKDIYGRDSREKELIEKTARYYLMEILNNAKCSPQKEEGIEEIRWTDAGRALKTIGYKNCVPILKKALKIIKKL